MLCQGSKDACILFDYAWMTPNEFQAESGRETAKDWKRSIKHHDKSIKLLMIKGLFSTDPAVCSCNYCTWIDAPQSPPPPPTISVTKVRSSNCRNVLVKWYHAVLPTISVTIWQTVTLPWRFSKLKPPQQTISVITTYKVLRVPISLFKLDIYFHNRRFS